MQVRWAVGNSMGTLPVLFQQEYRVCYHLCQQLLRTLPTRILSTHPCECRGCFLAVQARTMFPGVSELSQSCSKMLGLNGMCEKNNNKSMFEQWLMDKTPWKRGDTRDGLIADDASTELFESGVENRVFEREIQV